jgi:UDPglucose 6-dehydrogenase
MAKDGSCDTSIIKSSLQALLDGQYCGLVIAKSTAPFEVYERFAEKLELAFVPEFLRGAHAVEDYLDSEFLIVGSNSWSVHSSVVEVIYNSDLHKLSCIRRVSIREACLIKYFENSFLAVKVSLMNEFFSLAKSLGVNWERTIEALTLDKRIGADHTQVPGPDGHFGWGGHCLPKDTSALIEIAKQQMLRMPVLEEAVRVNTQTRKFYGGQNV